MSRYIHHLSGFFFFLLGFSLFGAYLFLRNGILPNWSAWWMQVVDLPFLLAACLYGGTGFHLILTRNKGGITSGLFIFLIVMMVFTLFALMNFWDVLPTSITGPIGGMF